MSEKKGKRLNSFQHCLQRPDTYIGSIETVEEEKHVAEEGGEVVKKLVQFNNGLFNIIREIGSNCIDNKWRSKKERKRMHYITVEISTEDGLISFINDGAYIPVVKEESIYEDYRKKKVTKEEVYPAELYFGEFLSGSNFDDDEERKTSGKNGMGAKATIAFSTYAEVNHADTKKIFSQVYENNGKDRTDPEITKNKGDPYTRVSFIPDFKRFGYKFKKNKKDFIELLRMYVLEIAALTSIPVTFTIDEESEVYHFKKFEEFVRKIYRDKKENKTFSITLHNGDECVIVESSVTSDTLDKSQHFSYVNGIKTVRGGVHVDKWTGAIFPAFVKAFNAKESSGKGKALKTTAKEVYPYITLFIRSEADKPKFDSQTKDYLSGPEYKFYPTKPKEYMETFKENIADLTKKMLKWGFVEKLKNKLLGKSAGPVKSVKGKIDLGNKSQDANNAGKEAEKCTLYIAEGLSAKALVVRGISTILFGQDYNGVFAIQGKFINAMNNTESKVDANKECAFLCQMLNLRNGVDYSLDKNFKTLRYHKIRIIADMDDDGIHIRGLLLNFFNFKFPSLFKREIIESFSTPVVQILFKNTVKTPELDFYTNKDFEKWFKKNSSKKSDIKQIKYLKGLGSINAKYAGGYFDDEKVVKYLLNGKEKKYMTLGFDGDKKNADDRKEFLTKDMVESKIYEIPEDLNIQDFEEEDKVSNEKDKKAVYDGELYISDFIKDQLSLYQRMSFRRAIPCIMDGLKEGQRKALYALRVKNYSTTQKLEKLGGAILEISGYHHGVISLYDTLRKQALRYPGSNNIPLFENDGEFGTRLENGEDHGQSRYLFTKLEDIVKSLFPKIDDEILVNRVEDGEVAEFEYFAPVICMSLVNGASGIASAFSTTIPNFNPKDIIEYIRRKIKGKKWKKGQLKPWYRDIQGEIEFTKSKKSLDYYDGIKTNGVIIPCGPEAKEKLRNKKYVGKTGWYHIIDLPVGIKTSAFESYIHSLHSKPKESKGKKKKDDDWEKKIADYSTYNSTDYVHMIIKPNGDWDPMEDKDFMKKLSATISMRNMVLIDENNYPKIYKTAEDILDVWIKKREYIYLKRYVHLLKKLQHAIDLATYKYKFIKLVVDKKLDVHQEDEALEKNMLKLKLKKMNRGVLDESEETFDYLLSMQMRSMTVKRMNELQNEIDKCQSDLDVLKEKIHTDLWLEDLDTFEKAYDKYMSIPIESKALDPKKKK